MRLMAACFNVGPGDDRRGTERDRTNLWAVLRQQKQPNEAIQIIDLSPEGCGFRSPRPMPVGHRVWLALPGLETWAATVAWFENGNGGLRFDRPLHPAVVARFVSGKDSAR